MMTTRRYDEISLAYALGQNQATYALEAREATTETRKLRYLTKKAEVEAILEKLLEGEKPIPLCNRCKRRTVEDWGDYCAPCYDILKIEDDWRGDCPICRPEPINGIQS